MGKELKEILNKIREQELVSDDSLVRESWRETHNKARRLRRRHHLAVTGVAASVALLIIAGYCLLPKEKPEESAGIEMYALRNAEYDVSNSQNIRLIMSEGEEMSVGGKESNIEYGALGKIIIDADTVTEVSDDSAPRYNQIIVPHGKRTKVVLSDGTKVFVNSGTRVIYPLRFGTGNREIYVEGEAYFDVAHDSSRPFIVKTADMTVQVLGTSFNVFAYKDAPEKHVVLVNGKVDVTDGKTPRKMNPGQKVGYREGKLDKPKTVNVEEYTSWVNYALSYDNASLETIFKRLHYYYGVDFNIQGDISRMHVSGKLDLKESIEDVMASIAYSVPITIRIDKNEITVSAN